MALTPIRLPRLPSSTQFTDPKTGTPTKRGQQWWQRAMEQIEAGVNGVIEAQNAAAVATAAAAVALAAAEDAQDAVDAIDVPPSGTRTVTASDSITTDDYTILADAAAGAITLTLPLAAAASTGFVVKKIDATANAVNVAKTGSDSINGGAGPVAITAPYEQRSVASDGIDAWYVS